MSKWRIFLWGVIAGQLACGPTIYKLYVTPRIEAMPISDKFYGNLIPRDFQIKNCPVKGQTLLIHIRPVEVLREVYSDRFGEDGSTLLGFTDYRRNEIYSADDTSILVHEIRHVFEGSFHR